MIHSLAWSESHTEMGAVAQHFRKPDPNSTKELEQPEGLTKGRQCFEDGK